MGKVRQCPSCNSYYNASIYQDKCPFCKTRSGETANPIIIKQKKNRGVRSSISDFWKKENNSENSRKKEEESKTDKTDATLQMEVKKTEPLNPDDTSHLSEKNSTEKTEKIDVVKNTLPLSQMESGEETDKEKDNLVPDSGSSNMTLSMQISRSGRTVGKYFSKETGDTILPVTGWLVSVKGVYFGRSFELKSGKNKIGRSHDMDVKLLNDESVSRSSAAVIVFDSKQQEFSILPGESDWLCYVNGKALYERVVLNGYEEIEFGDSENNKYMFVPFCGKQFQWDAGENKKSEK